VRSALQARSSRAAEIAEIALQAWPVDPELLLLAALTALASEQPERAHAVLKRYGKRYPPGKAITLLTSLALAQQGKQDQVWALLQAAQLETDRAAIGWFVGDDVMEDWLLGQLRAMRRLGRRPPGPSPRAARPAKPAPTRVSIPRPPAARAVSPAGPVLPIVVDLPRLQARFDMTFDLADPNRIEIDGACADEAAFRPRAELVRLSLFEGFDELLCLPAGAKEAALLRLLAQNPAERSWCSSATVTR